MLWIEASVRPGERTSDSADGQKISKDESRRIRHPRGA